MSKGKLYKKNTGSGPIADLVGLIIGIGVYALVLYISNNVFVDLYIENFKYCLVAAVILSALDYTIKPILVYLTLPINIITFGITYPIVNMIILKICDYFMGVSFSINGILSAFFISIFISILKIIFDAFINNVFGGK